MSGDAAYASYTNVVIFDMQQPSARPSEDQSVVNTVASPDEDVFAADLAAETVQFQFLTLQLLLHQHVVELHRSCYLAP